MSWFFALSILVGVDLVLLGYGAFPESIWSGLGVGILCGILGSVCGAIVEGRR